MIISICPKSISHRVGLTSLWAGLFGMGWIFAHQIEPLAVDAYWMLTVTGIGFQLLALVVLKDWAMPPLQVNYHFILRLVVEQQLSLVVRLDFHHCIVVT